MKCILCSAEIEEGMSACPKCGSSYGLPQAEPTTPPVEESAPVVQNETPSAPVEPVAPAAPLAPEVPAAPVAPVQPIEPVTPVVAPAPIQPIEQPNMVNQNVGMVNMNNIPESPAPQPMQGNFDYSNTQPVQESGSSSVIPYIFIGIIIIAIGYVGFLFATGHKLFGKEDITEDLPSTTTVQGSSVTPTSTVTTDPTEPTSGIVKTTVKADLNNENLIVDIDNYTTTYTISLTASGTSMSFKISGVVDQKNKKDSLKVTTTMSGGSVTVPAYYDYNTGYIYMENPSSKGTWLKQKTSDPFTDLKTYISRMNNNKDVTKVDEGHYRIKITKEEMKGMVSQSGVDLSLIKGDPVMDIYTKDGYITKIETDMSNVIQGVSKYKIVQTFSLYDQSGEVTIPQDIINNAKNY